MRTTVMVFHPHIASSRVNRALADKAASLEDVTVRHMYELYPSFRIDVAAEHEMAKQADRIVLQFPMYWYSCPPLLKQWEDDVLTYGWAYGSDGKALQGKDLLIAVSPGSNQYGRGGNYHYGVTELLRPFQATSNLIGTRYVEPFVTVGAMTISDADLAQQCEQYAEVLRAESLPTLDTFG